ncbi:MAG: hypothetical protein KGZ38_08725, partial [Erysipelothrix sp.]|nr:hypothetical protein [Erysipelothrix sp.]
CRYTRYRGLEKVQDYTYLLFASMNMKKIALWTSRKDSPSSLFGHIIDSFIQLMNIKTGLVLQVKF